MLIIDDKKLINNIWKYPKVVKAFKKLEKKNIKYECNCINLDDFNKFIDNINKYLINLFNKRIYIEGIENEEIKNFIKEHYELIVLNFMYDIINNNINIEYVNSNIDKLQGLDLYYINVLINYSFKYIITINIDINNIKKEFEQYLRTGFNKYKLGNYIKRNKDNYNVFNDLDETIKIYSDEYNNIINNYYDIYNSFKDGNLIKIHYNEVEFKENKARIKEYDISNEEDIKTELNNLKNKVNYIKLRRKTFKRKIDKNNIVGYLMSDGLFDNNLNIDYNVWFIKLIKYDKIKKIYYINEIRYYYC